MNKIGKQEKELIDRILTVIINEGESTGDIFRNRINELFPEPELRRVLVYADSICLVSLSVSHLVKITKEGIRHIETGGFKGERRRKRNSVLIQAAWSLASAVIGGLAV